MTILVRRSISNLRVIRIKMCVFFFTDDLTLSLSCVRGQYRRNSECLKVPVGRISISQIEIQHIIVRL